MLFVQSDNCWRENKNQFVLGLLGLYVEVLIIIWFVCAYCTVAITLLHHHNNINMQFGVYTTVYYNFMLAGHAHDDYDQMATTFKTKLKHAYGLFSYHGATLYVLTLVAVLYATPTASCLVMLHYVML